MSGWDKSHLDSEEPLGRGWTIEYYITLDGRWRAAVTHQDGGGVETIAPTPSKAHARAEIEKIMYHHYGFVPWSVPLSVAERILRERAPGKSEQDYALMLLEMFPHG